MVGELKKIRKIMPGLTGSCLVRPRVDRAPNEQKGIMYFFSVLRPVRFTCHSIALRPGCLFQTENYHFVFFHFHRLVYCS